MEARNEQLEVLEDVHEMLSEALKLAANEPSVGLYYVQQHVHKAVPILLHVKNQITEVTGDADLATADAKDSLSCIKSMKDCGPPIIERMIKTLQSASNQIPTMRQQSRGSFSQLLPKPGRLSKGPLRTSSFIGDWRSNPSTNKGWENFQRERPMAERVNKRVPALPIPDSKRAEPSEERAADLNKQAASTSSGCDSSDAMMSNEMSGCSNDASTSDPSHYVLSLLGSAISKSREGMKLIMAKDVENQLGDGRVAELKNWISGQSLPGFSRKSESVPENSETHIHMIKSGISSEDLIKMRDDFEHFQVERAAKLEAWLSEPDDMHSITSSQEK